MKYHTFNHSKLPKKQWVNRLLTWIQTRKWPNGDHLFSGKFLNWLHTKVLGTTNEHDTNHERRLRRAYLRNGILGVSHYLNTIGCKHEFIVECLNDFEQSNDDIRTVKRYQKQVCKKFIKA